jgi:hypothetical protein
MIYSRICYSDGRKNRNTKVNCKSIIQSFYLSFVFLFSVSILRALKNLFFMLLVFCFIEKQKNIFAAKQMRFEKSLRRFNPNKLFNFMFSFKISVVIRLRRFFSASGILFCAF